MSESQNHGEINFQTAFEARFVFFLVCVGVFSLTYGFLFAIDFIPQSPHAEGNNAASTRVEQTGVTQMERLLVSDEKDPNDHSLPVTSIETDSRSDDDTITTHALSQNDAPLNVYPTRIILDALDDRSVPILNPIARDIETLDAALLNGVVRHPDSGDFDRIGTIVLFGHSSYLPNVMNKNFQAFNGIQKLAWGDIVRLQSESREYLYRVDRVYEASASDADAEVKVEAGKRKLTLVTCDSFGSKSDRFIVEASLIEERTRAE